MGEDLMEAIRAFEADHVWVIEHRVALRAQYPEQWIAVKEGRVIASDADLMSLRARLPDPANTCIEFITHEPVELTFRSHEGPVVLPHDLWAVKHDLDEMPPGEVSRLLRLPSILGRDLINRYRFTGDTQNGSVRLERP